MRKLILLFCCIVNMAFAENNLMPINETSTNIQAYKTIYANTDTSKNTFDIKESYKIFDQTNLKLSTQNLDIHDLVHAIKLFKKLNSDAEECIETTQKRLSNINNLIQLTSPAINEKPISPEITADQAYLKKEQKELTNRQAQCRLFTIKSGEVITRYQSVVAELKKVETFSQSSPAWEYLPKFKHLWQEHKLFKTELSINQFEFEWQKWFIHAILSLFTTIAILWIFSYKTNLKRIFSLKQYYFSWMSSLFLSIWFLFNWTWCEIHDIHLASDEHICDLFKIFSVISCLYFFNTFIFSIKRVRALFYWYELDFNYFYKINNVIISLSALLHLSKWFKVLILPSKTTTLVFQSLFLFITLFFNVYFFFRFINKHRHYKWIRSHQKGLKAINIIYCSACLLFNIFGYHVLAMRLVYSSLTIIAILFGTVLMVQAFQKLYALTVTKPLIDKIYYIFGYRENQHLVEFLMLKYSLQTIAIAYGLYLIGENMGFISYYVTKFYQPILDGITLGNITLYPARSVFGVITFSLIFLLCRSISTLITRYHQFNEEDETQVAVASILNYIGFAIALVSGLLISGFNFTGLAIVAGALSVGIGLGLQSIVNNFVSGLILLIEKPLKPGDRIQVDGVEGTVKKIRVRSTQIITPAREDIIVPNSDLVTRRVTNFMYTDRYLSIFCQVPVAYNSNVELVKELLLKAAMSHDEVIKTGRNKPNVLLKSFGDYGLNFQLWCLIKDANKKSIVQSDLNFSILKLFSDNRIEIPIPEQNLYLHKV
jgi:potassium efflux system protein